jgi:hypothetical protein
VPSLKNAFQFFRINDKEEGESKKVDFGLADRLLILGRRRLNFRADSSKAWFPPTWQQIEQPSNFPTG